VNPEQSEIFDELFSTFTSRGWKIFIEEVTAQFNTLQETSYLTCNTNDEWQKQRGIIQSLKSVMNYETSVKAQYDSVLEEEQEQDATDDI